MSSAIARVALTRASRRNPHYKLVRISRHSFHRYRALPMVTIAVIEAQIRLHRSGRGDVNTSRAPRTLLSVGLLESRLHGAEELRSRQFGRVPIGRFPTILVALEPRVEQLRGVIEIKVGN